MLSRPACDMVSAQSAESLQLFAWCVCYRMQDCLGACFQWCMKDCIGSWYPSRCHVWYDGYLKAMLWLCCPPHIELAWVCVGLLRVADGSLLGRSVIKCMQEAWSLLGLPWFNAVCFGRWAVHVCPSCCFLVLPRHAVMQQERYLGYVPILWLTCPKMHACGGQNTYIRSCSCLWLLDMRMAC